MAIEKKLLDQLLKDYKKPEDLLGESGIIKQLTKALLERAMDAELTTHLGYEKNTKKGKKTSNSRNGYSRKTVISDSGDINLSIPRDRRSEFEPHIVPKGQRRFTGFDDKIISLYARGLSTREIQGHLEEIYNVEVSPTLISNVTAAVLDEVVQWQSRPLDRIYPIVYLDAISVKSREDGSVTNKSVYLALGVNMEGRKELLGLWIAKTEGAKFWLSVLTDLRNRGVEDIYIACVDGLKGFPDAIEAEFPETKVQLCIVHMVRNSLKYVSWKDRKQVAKDLKKIYHAVTVDEARNRLTVFGETWNEKYPTIAPLWERNWDGIVPFFAYPEDIRKVIYTTNAIESLNRSIRKIIKTRGAFPNDESIFKLLYLSIRNASKKWTMPIRNWKKALNRFAIEFEDRFPKD